MQKLIRTTLTATLLATSALTFAACSSHHHEGPAQHAGRKIDHGLDKTGDAIEHTGHEINRALPGD